MMILSRLAPGQNRRIDGRLFGRLDGFRPQLGDGTRRVDADAEHAGEWTEPDRRYEEEREHEAVDPAQHVQEDRAGR